MNVGEAAAVGLILSFFSESRMGLAIIKWETRISELLNIYLLRGSLLGYPLDKALMKMKL